MSNLQNRQYQLHHADCFDVFYELEDNSIDAIITDPPYGILKGCKIETDINIKRFLSECYRVLKPNSFLIFFGQQPTLSFWNVEALNQSFNHKNEVIWYKRYSGSMLLDMNRVFENISIFTKGKRKYNDIRRPYCDVKESLAEFVDIQTTLSAISDFTRTINTPELAKEWVHGGQFNIKKIRNYKSTIQSEIKSRKTIINKVNTIVYGFKPQNLISFKPHNKQKLDISKNGGGEHNVKHPTVKPIELLAYLIALTTNENDLILDPFVGSGTTILAALQEKRRCIGVEIHREFHDIAQYRINKQITKPKQLELI